MFEENDELVLVSARRKVYVEDKNLFIYDKEIVSENQVIEGNKVFLNFIKGNHIHHLTSIYDRKHAMQIGYYQENIQSSDWESVLRLILNKKVGFINEFVTVWRKHSQNASREIDIDAIIKNTKFIDNAYNKAISLKITDKKTLAKWREKMLIRMFLNFIVKVLYIAPNQLELLLQKIKEYNQDIFVKIKNNIKYRIFRLIYKRKKIVHLIFKYILKKESFISDLQ